MALSQQDLLKIISMGFTIIRADEQRLRIKHKTIGQLDWKDLEKGFQSKAALDRRMKELLKLKNIIED